MNNGISALVLIVSAIVGFSLFMVFFGTPHGQYAYRCNDGTEFSVTPAEDRSSIHLYPSTSVERIPESTLAATPSASGTRFVGDSLVFAGTGKQVQLIGKSFSTTCTPVGQSYDWGA